MFKIQISKRKDFACFGHLELVFGIYLEFGFWDLEFHWRFKLGNVRRNEERKACEKHWVIWGDLQPHPYGALAGSGGDPGDLQP